MNSDNKIDRLKAFINRFYERNKNAFVTDFQKYCKMSRAGVLKLIDNGINKYEHLKALEGIGISIEWYLDGNKPMFADNENGHILEKIWDSEFKEFEQKAVKYTLSEVFNTLREKEFIYLGSSAATGNKKE